MTHKTLIKGCITLILALLVSVSFATTTSTSNACSEGFSKLDTLLTCNKVPCNGSAFEDAWALTNYLVQIGIACTSYTELGTLSKQYCSNMTNYAKELTTQNYGSDLKTAWSTFKGQYSEAASTIESNCSSLSSYL